MARCFGPERPCSVQGQDMQIGLLFIIFNSDAIKSEFNTNLIYEPKKEIKNNLHFDAKNQKQLIYADQKTTTLLEYKLMETIPDYSETF